MTPAGFELTIPGSRRPQTHAWDPAVTGIGQSEVIGAYFKQTTNSTLKLLITS